MRANTGVCFCFVSNSILFGRRVLWKCQVAGGCYWLVQFVWPLAEHQQEGCGTGRQQSNTMSIWLSLLGLQAHENTWTVQWVWVF